MYRCVHVRVRRIEAECHPYYREEACSLVIGLFRSQEGAPSSEEETHVLSRCLLLAGTRLRRDETRSVCVCVCESISVSGKRPYHFSSQPLHPSVPCPYRLAAAEVDNTWLVYAPVSSSLMDYFRRPAHCQRPNYQF